MEIKKLIKRIAISGGVIVGLIIVWGLLEPYYIKVEREEVSIPNLSESWKGEEIAVVGDFQVGMWMDNTYTIERVVDRLIEMEPKAVLITGDFVYHTVGDRDTEVKKVQNLLRPLAETGIPVFTVLGNHDYGMDKETTKPNLVVAEKVSSALEDIGVHVLRNESVPLSLSDQESHDEVDEKDLLYLVGIGSKWPELSMPILAFEDVPEHSPRIVLTHNPNTFSELEAGSSPLTMAGHTHGGQMRIPFTPSWSYLSLVKDGKVHPYGWFDKNGEPGNHLYVNPGIGFSGVPLRINVPPEITVFSLS